MAEIIGLSRIIKKEWLANAAELAIAGYSRKEAGDKLDELIGQTINSPDSIRKARTILLHVWFDSLLMLREKAIEIYHSVGTNERTGIFWSLLMEQYQIFFDLCAVIGHMFSFRDVITSAQIKEQIFNKWGERGTLVTSLPKNIRTLRELGTMSTAGRVGTYQRAQIQISDPHVAWMLLSSLLRVSDAEYISWDDFAQHPALFPFVIDGVNEADMAAMKGIELERISDRTVMRLC